MNLHTLDILDTPLPYQASKPLSLDFLIDPNELIDLLNHLGDVLVLPNGGMFLEANSGKEALIQAYQSYVESLFGETRTAPLAYLLTDDPRSVYLLRVKGEQFVIKCRAPTIQLIQHTFMVTEDKRMQSIVFGHSPIRWGLRFSFPQLFIDPVTKEVKYPLKEGGELFRKVQSWIRDHTRPTPFSYEGSRLMATFRLGLQAREWIQDHDDLKQKGIKCLS